MTPRYQAIYTALKDEISAGAWPTGANLPTEAVLCERFEVSRHTVREALRRLQADGLIARRQGAGSRVLATGPSPRFATTVSSLSELMEYTASTYLEVLTRERVLIGTHEAGRLGCPPDTLWTRVTLLRRDSPGGVPVCYTLCYLPAPFDDIVGEIGAVQTAVYRLIEDRHGVALRQVHQIVEATLADADIASRLGIATGAPVLTVTRRYQTDGDGLMQVTVSHHPAATFRHEMTLTNMAGGSDPATGPSGEPAPD